MSTTPPKPPKPPKPPGRQTKLTEELLTNIETLLRNHNSVKAVCQTVGIAERTYYRWLTESEATDPPAKGLMRQFSQRVNAASGLHKAVLVQSIAADADWRAKAWLLERLHHEEFGRRTLISHAGPDGSTPLNTAVPITVTIQMQGADGVVPWVMKDGQDPEPENGSDPWGTDTPEWPKEAPEPTEDAPATTTAPNPAFNPPSTGGKSRDPDQS